MTQKADCAFWDVCLSVILSQALFPLASLLLRAYSPVWASCSWLPLVILDSPRAGDLISGLEVGLDSSPAPLLNQTYLYTASYFLLLCLLLPGPLSSITALFWGSKGRVAALPENLDTHLFLLLFLFVFCAFLYCFSLVGLISLSPCRPPPHPHTHFYQKFYLWSVFFFLVKILALYSFLNQGPWRWLSLQCKHDHIRSNP